MVWKEEEEECMRCGRRGCECIYNKVVRIAGLPHLYDSLSNQSCVCCRLSDSAVSIDLLMS